MKQKKYITQKPLRVLTTSVVLGTTILTYFGNSSHPIGIVHAQENVTQKNVSSTARETLEAPIVEAFRAGVNGSYFIKGRGKANAKVVVNVQQKQFESLVKADGTWEIEIPIRVKDDEEFILTLVDIQGNKSKELKHIHKNIYMDLIAAKDYGEISGWVMNIFEGKVKATIGNETYEGMIENNKISIKTPKLVVGTEVLLEIEGYNFRWRDSIIVTDGTAPDAPKVNELTDEDTQVTGTGEANAKVTIQTATASYEGTINSEGNWSVSIPKQVENTKLQVIVMDAAGNKSKPTEKVVKFSKWNAPKVNKIGDSDIKVSGMTEAGAKVVAKIGDQLYEGIAEANGTFSIDIPKQVAGTEVIVKMTKDGKESKEVKEIVEDVTAPDAPYVNTISDKDVVVIGKGEIGTTVNVQIGKEIYTGVVGTDGNFSVAIPRQEARTQVSVKLIDSIGNKSETTKVMVKVSPLEAPQVDEYYEEAFRITGKVKPGTNKIRLYVDGQLKRTGAIQENGTFAIYVGDFNLSQGKEFRVVPVDINGREGTAHTSTVQGKQGRFELSIDSYASDTPHIRGMVSEDIKKVRLYLNGTYIRTGQINKDGTYTIYAKDQNIPVGSYFEVRGVDNQERERVKEKRLVSLGTPQVDGYHEGDLRITGKVPPSTQKIRLYVDGKLKRTGAIQEDGTFVIYAGDFNLSQGKEFKVVAVDGSGAEGTAYIGIVQAMQGDYVLQANSYVLKDTYVRGTVSSEVKKVRIYIDGQFKRTGQINKDGTYLIYAKDQQISIDSEVEVRGVDHAEKERVTKKVEIKE
ncbi:Ig-like domain-containing protein [Bacillus thuringiensis]|nr:Ig-like domain-containing protein [Bacillus thuringiensis]